MSDGTGNLSQTQYDRLFHTKSNEKKAVTKGDNVETDNKPDENKEDADQNLQDNFELLKEALKYANENRKFEIELYWKRAAYFWTLIAITFTGYFSILNAKDISHHRFVSLTIACIGFFFTLAWFQVSRGSKQWQENWENHVDLLEDNVTGPLYKTVLRRPTSKKENNTTISNICREKSKHINKINAWFKDNFEKYVTGPSDVSVSRINQIVNFFTLCIWFVLINLSWSAIYCHFISNNKNSILIIIVLLFCWLVVCNGKTSSFGHEPVANKRETKISSD